MRVAVIVLVMFAATGASLAALPQTPLGPKATADEVKTYEAFRAWLTKQPADVQEADDAVVFQRCGAELARQDQSEKDVAAITASLGPDRPQLCRCA